MLNSRRKSVLVVAGMVMVGIITFRSNLKMSVTLFEDSDKEVIETTSSAHITSTSSKQFEISKLTETMKTTQQAEEPDLNFEWESQTEPMTHLDVETRRCKAHDHGCFILVRSGEPTFVKTSPKNLKVIFGKNQEATKENCLDICFTKLFKLAAFNPLQKSCRCSTGFDGFISSRAHNAAANSAEANDCKSAFGYHVYSKIRDCERGIPRQSLQLDKVGCMNIPKKLNLTMIALTHFQMSTEQCILNCEMRHFTFAVPVPQKYACLCSDSYSLFETVDNMSKIMSGCSGESKTLTSDNEVEVYRTTVIDEHCEPLRFLPQKQAAPVVLASYYGSGNTWIRHLIELSTGIYTGSVYNDVNLFEGGMLGEYLPDISGRTVVFKDHLFKLTIKPHVTMAVLLIRNPYDATLAEYTRKMTKNHTGLVDTSVFRTTGFKSYAKGRPNYWFGITEQLLKTFNDKVVVVYFEDLVKDPIKEMRRIVKFLPATNVEKNKEALERRLMCLNMDSVGNFKRPPRKLSFDPFDAFLRNIFDKKIRAMDDLLIEHHHPPIPDSYFLPY